LRGICGLVCGLLCGLVWFDLFIAILIMSVNYQKKSFFWLWIARDWKPPFLDASKKNFIFF
jgi:hypothetical protein